MQTTSKKTISCRHIGTQIAGLVPAKGWLSAVAKTYGILRLRRPVRNFKPLKVKQKLPGMRGMMIREDYKSEKDTLRAKSRAGASQPDST